MEPSPRTQVACSTATIVAGRQPEESTSEQLDLTRVQFSITRELHVTGNSSQRRETVTRRPGSEAGRSRHRSRQFALLTFFYGRVPEVRAGARALGRCSVRVRSLRTLSRFASFAGITRVKVRSRARRSGAVSFSCRCQRRSSFSHAGSFVAPAPPEPGCRS